jgi:mRNA turnover protein 4
MGVKATRNVIIPEGPVMRRVEEVSINELDEETDGPHYLPSDKEDIMAFPNNMETQLRGLGMPTLLKGGKINYVLKWTFEMQKLHGSNHILVVPGVILLMRPYTICNKGDILTPSQAQLLKHFQLKMATFQLRIIGKWSDGEYERLIEEDEGDNQMEGAEGDDDDAEMDEE